MTNNRQSTASVFSSTGRLDVRATFENCAAADLNLIQSTPVNRNPPNEGATTPNANNPKYESDNCNDLAEPVKGWPQVALLMAKTPDLAAFDRFRDLNTKSLLYYQTQLTLLRKRLHNCEYNDLRNIGHANDDRQLFAKHAHLLVEAESSKQWELIIEIRKLLKEYNKALLRFSQVSALPEPDNYSMKSLRAWLRDPRAGNFSIAGNGEESTWGDLYDFDTFEMGPSIWSQFLGLLWGLIWINPPPSSLGLVATTPPRKSNNFTRWVVHHLVPFCANIRRYTEKRKPRTDEESLLIKRAARVANEETLITMSVWSTERGSLTLARPISTIVACLLPTIAIAVLSRVHGLTNLLLCLAGFVVTFAIGVVLFTNCTRVEVFTATSAFSAVLVVFISVPVINVAPGVTVTTGEG